MRIYFSFTFSSLYTLSIFLCSHFLHPLLLSTSISLKTESHYIVPDSLKLSKICLPLFPYCLDQSCAPPCLFLLLYLLKTLTEARPKVLGLFLELITCEAWQCKTVISALGSWRQEDKKLKVIPPYNVSSRPALPI